MADLFSISSVSAGYGINIFIRGLDLAVAGGEFVSFIGPNGAGKSTIIRLLAGMLAPASGTVSFCGREINGFGARELARNFSVVMRITGNVPAFSVRSFLGFGMFAHSGPVRAGVKGIHLVDEMALRTGIMHLMERSVNELSTGEFQLVQVARALVQNSGIIILDEPVSNLDYRHSTMVMDILRDLNRSGTTVICALHDVNCASNYSSRIVCVKNGGIFIEGAPGSVVKPEIMNKLYDAEFMSLVNPATGSPMIVPVPGSV
ncbi:MAG TPA: ABC transporter ATP-binding protein [Spirochaetota bacterium]|nr:ABC transporter ATP-binding protein [Spirochaetota bacterium]